MLGFRNSDDIELAPPGATVWVEEDATVMVSRRTVCKMLGLGAVVVGAGFDPVGLLKVSMAEAAPIKITGTTSTVARHGLTAAAYQQQFTRWTSEGYWPLLVNGYGIGGADFYTLGLHR